MSDTNRPANVISFAKDAGPQELRSSTGGPLQYLSVTVTWDSTGGSGKGLGASWRRHRGTDLDLAVLAYNGDNEGLRICTGFDQKNLWNGAATHMGDDKKGRGGETVHLDLARFPQDVGALIITLNAFKPKVSFADVAGADCYFSEGFEVESPQIGHFAVPIVDKTKASIFMAKIVRGANGIWAPTKLGTRAGNGDIRELLAEGERILAA